MAKTPFIELGEGKRLTRIPIIYEDRSVLAVDKPPGWMLVPFSWQNTSRNLMAAITSSIAAGDFWARSRSLKFLRNVHRLDAETSGVLLFAKSLGAVNTYSELFESRRMEKTYLAVAQGKPKAEAWTCSLALAPNPSHHGQMMVDAQLGKEAETHFRVLAVRTDGKLGELALIEARPVTGRTHQIRVHLASAGLPIVGDELYNRAIRRGEFHEPHKFGSLKSEVKSRTRGTRLAENSFVENELPTLALRAISLCYHDPFQKRPVVIRAPAENFTRNFGFEKS